VRQLVYAAALALAGTAAAADPRAGENKAAVCTACHGEAGNSTNPTVPSIAGQPEKFIATALYMFRAGSRQDPQMTPMAKPLSNAQMNDLAAYFAAQKPAPPRHQASAASASAGPELAKKFNCTQCHGPRLLGQQQMPRLAGQHYEYLRAQLAAFKAGKRADLDGNMTAAAQALSDKDLEVLADYIAGLGGE
jgi:cytochrome c553